MYKEAWAPDKNNWVTVLLDKLAIKLWIKGAIKSSGWPKLNFTILNLLVAPSTTRREAIGAAIV